MKAVIPVAGAGTRLRPFTYTQPKSLLPVAGKPMLSFIIDQLIEAGFNDFVLIIGYLGEKIRDYVLKEYPYLKVAFAYQEHRSGLGDALYQARDLVNKEELFIVLGDTIVDMNFKDLLDYNVSTLGIKKVDDPRLFGVAKINKENLITQLEEKPIIPKSNMALVGVYYIKETDLLMSCLSENITGNHRPRGEFHLTDALAQMLKKGAVFKGVKVNNWYDLGRGDVLLETNAKLLKKTHQYTPVDGDRYLNTVIIPPVHIPESAKISHSVIGPNVSIGEHAKIKSSIIKDSIIAEYTNIKNMVLNQSIIGSDAVVKGFSQSLNIGDNTAIDLRGRFKSSN